MAGENVLNFHTQGGGNHVIGGCLTVISGGNEVVQSGGVITVASGGDVVVQSGGDVTVASGGNLTVASGGTANFTGATVTLPAGGATLAKLDFTGLKILT